MALEANLPPPPVMEVENDAQHDNASDSVGANSNQSATENVIFELDNADDWMQQQLDTNDTSVNIQDESLLPTRTSIKKRKIDFSSQAGTSGGNTGEPGAKYI
ncbi:hypothetical protein SFRURICE_018964 [Spodoptera frugiperda]|nr:hypothetical protein SFRURICE_018963 [Spodoptera frugiperda]KAF9801401.1 hypothetical protein SFRURICE_018964 [Spodoptera frugiperda]